MINVSYSETLASQMISINRTPEGEVFLPHTHHFLGFPASIATSIGRSLQHNYWIKAQVTKVPFTSHNTKGLTGTSAPNWHCLAC